jgi:hypothetical protein
MILYRGTKDISDIRVFGKKKKKPKTAPSFTDSLPVAIIWSAVPGDSYTREDKAGFIPSSVVQAAEFNCRKILDLRKYGLYTGLSSVLEELGYGSNPHFTIDEALKIYAYLHNRIIGKAFGGEFKYRLAVDQEFFETEVDDFDEDEHEFDDEGKVIVTEHDVPLSLRVPMTQIYVFGVPSFEFNPSIETARGLIADTFVFADAPAVQRVARASGYDCIVYEDVFEGGESAAPEILGVNVLDIPGIKEEEDIEDEWLPAHDTYRPLNLDAFRILWEKPAPEVLERWRSR